MAREVLRLEQYQALGFTYSVDREVPLEGHNGVFIVVTLLSREAGATETYWFLTEEALESWNKGSNSAWYKRQVRTSTQMLSFKTNEGGSTMLGIGPQVGEGKEERQAMIESPCRVIEP